MITEVFNVEGCVVLWGDDGGQVFKEFGLLLGKGITCGLLDLQFVLVVVRFARWLMIGLLLFVGLLWLF